MSRLNRQLNNHTRRHHTHTGTGGEDTTATAVHDVHLENPQTNNLSANTVRQGETTQTLETGLPVQEGETTQTLETGLLVPDGETTQTL